MADAVKESSSNFCTMFSEKMEESKKFRRVIFPIWIIILFLYLFPTSHWGPWYKYQTGTASCYGSGFWFKKTSSGDRFIPFFHTAAHKTLPLGIIAKVVNNKNGKTVYVKINDRGPFVKGRVIDLSTSAAKKIGIFRKGTGTVTIYTGKNYKK
jgi:rare lipoprotein A (peptidoglycan hydrolase)